MRCAVLLASVLAVAHATSFGSFQVSGGRRLQLTPCQQTGYASYVCLAANPDHAEMCCAEYAAMASTCGINNAMEAAIGIFTNTPVEYIPAFLDQVGACPLGVNAANCSSAQAGVSTKCPNSNDCCEAAGAVVPACLGLGDDFFGPLVSSGCPVFPEAVCVAALAREVTCLATEADKSKCCELTKMTLMACTNQGSQACTSADVDLTDMSMLVESINSCGGAGMTLCTGPGSGGGGNGGGSNNGGSNGGSNWGSNNGGSNWGSNWGSNNGGSNWGSNNGGMQCDRSRLTQSLFMRQGQLLTTDMRLAASPMAVYTDGYNRQYFLANYQMVPRADRLQRAGPECLSNNMNM